MTAEVIDGIFNQDRVATCPRCNGQAWKNLVSPDGEYFDRMECLTWDCDFFITFDEDEDIILELE